MKAHNLGSYVTEEDISLLARANSRAIRHLEKYGRFEAETSSESNDADFVDPHLVMGGCGRKIREFTYESKGGRTEVRIIA